MQPGVPNSSIWNCLKVKREKMHLYSTELKENKINFKPLGNLAHLCGFFTLLPPQAFPEGNFYHWKELSIQGEIIVKNEPSSTSHSAISVQRAWSLEGCGKSERWYRFIIQKYIFKTDILLASS